MKSITILQKLHRSLRSYTLVLSYSTEAASLSSVICLDFGPFYRSCIALFGHMPWFRAILQKLHRSLRSYHEIYCHSTEVASLSSVICLGFGSFYRRTLSLLVFCHVPEAITCRFATDFGQEQVLCFDTAPRLKQPIQIPGSVGRAG